METLAVANDTHILAPHSEGITVDELIALKKKYTHVILNGDIIDMTNCRKKLVGHGENLINILKQRFGDDYVLGNHEAMDIGKGYTVKEINGKKVLFLHGPGLFAKGEYWPVYYEIDSTLKWEKKKRGRGRSSYWKYKMYRSFSKHKGGNKRPKDKVIKRLFTVMEVMGCEVVVFGHTHRTFDRWIADPIGSIKMKRIINTGKGITEVTI